MPQILERPEKFEISLSHIAKGLRGHYLVNALVAFIFAASAPVAIVLTAGKNGGLSEAEIASWLFGCFFLNGLISLTFTLAYRQPLVFFWTIPGTVLVAQALEHLTFAQAIGAFYATGLFMLVLGLTGWMRKAMDLLPMPIVMAMVAGVFLQFGLGLIFAIRDGFMIAAPMTAVFIALMAWPALGRRLPPLIGALIVGVAVVAATGAFNYQGSSAAILASPQFTAPEFSLAAMIELIIPLAITVLAAQNAQGFAVLTAAGHKPPVNIITSACGLGSLITATVGTVSTCFTGPVTAILASSGERQYHYVAGLIVAVLALLFGIFVPVFTRFMLASPDAFIAALAGLALVPILQRAFIVSFAGPFSLGAAVCFIVTVANVPIFTIGAPFWAMVIGYCVSRLLEPADFAEAAAPARAEPAGRSDDDASGVGETRPARD